MSARKSKAKKKRKKIFLFGNPWLMGHRLVLVQVERNSGLSKSF
jgi:hypothetical protein